jgi:hypothetical protein
MEISDIIHRDPGILHSTIDDEIVLFSGDTNSYFNLNRTGSIIWELIENPISVQELINQLATRFQIAPSEITNDVMEYIIPLEKKGIIKKSVS